MKASLFEHLDRIREMLARPPFGLMLDVDGTISEIADTPEAASVSSIIKEHMQQLAKRLPLVAIISGRSVESVREMLDLDDLVYVGNHGLEWWARKRSWTMPGVKPYRQEITRAIGDIQQRIRTEGVVIENKGATAAIHFRQAKDARTAKEAIIGAIYSSTAAQALDVKVGKMVVELRPPLRLNKGWAVGRLARAFRLRGMVYLGDDTTDLDAFDRIRRLRSSGTTRGLAAAVLGPETSPLVVESADVTLQGVPEVERFLRWLVQEKY